MMTPTHKRCVGRWFMGWRDMGVKSGAKSILTQIAQAITKHWQRKCPLQSTTCVTHGDQPSVFSGPGLLSSVVEFMLLYRLLSLKMGIARTHAGARRCLTFLFFISGNSDSLHSGSLETKPANLPQLMTLSLRGCLMWFCLMLLSTLRFLHPNLCFPSSFLCMNLSSFSRPKSPPISLFICLLDIVSSIFLFPGQVTYAVMQDLRLRRALNLV